MHLFGERKTMKHFAKVVIAVAAAAHAAACAAQDDALFSPAFFWLWNDRLDVPALCSQLEDMRAHGMRNVCIHPVPKAFRPYRVSSGMEPDYLTDGYLKAFAAVVRRAGELGMHAYLYDEGGWPSGGACGQVADSDADGRFRVRMATLAADGSVAVKARDYRRGGPAPYPSIIEDGTTRRFLELTHGKYAAALGDALGSTVRVAFTDEPCRPTGKCGESIAWAADFPEVFRAKKGYDIMPHVAKLISGGDDADEALAPVRIDFRDVMADLVVDRYLLPIRDWCRAHGMASGGHLNGEDMVDRASYYGHGSILRSLRAMDVPGVDVIWRQLFPATETSQAAISPFPRYASSAMHQNGGRFALSESFAIFGDSVSPAQAKWVLDYQLVRGINTFVLAYYAQSYAGQWMALFEPHGGPVSPCWDFMPHMFGYLENASRMLSSGKPGAEIAVLYDIRGVWAGGADREAAAWSHYAVAKALDRMNCDYDFVDDDQLAAAEVLPDGRIRVGAMEYRAVVLPTSKWMLAAAKEKCAALRAAGGVVAHGDDLSKVPRTLRFSGPDAEMFRVAKRVDGARETWFVVNEDIGRRMAKISFPGGGRVVRYDPETDRFESVSGAGRVSRFFEGGESAVFVTGDVPAAESPFVPDGTPVATVSKGWTIRPVVSHEVGDRDFVVRERNDPAKPAGLGDWRGTIGEKFSGKVVYRAEFDAPCEGDAMLDLGEVKWCAAVRFNGKDLGARFFGPFRWRISLKKGGNVVEVTVANLLVNQIGSEEVRNRIARQFPPRSSYDRWQQPFDRENHSSGLFGPVRVFRHRR